MNKFEQYFQELEGFAKAKHGKDIQGWFDYLLILLENQDSTMTDLKSDTDKLKQFLEFSIYKCWKFIYPDVSTELIDKMCEVIFQNLDFLLVENNQFLDLYYKAHELLTEESTEEALKM